MGAPRKPILPLDGDERAQLAELLQSFAQRELL
jgi:hypothetical protein